MRPEYTTVMDAGAAHLPSFPFIVVLAMPVLLFAFAYVARARKWHSATRTVQLGLWALYLAYTPLVLYQYWTLWDNRAIARNALQMSIEAGPVDAAAIVQQPEGLFVETRQRFAVNGVNFEYRQLNLRYMDFLMPQTELVKLPLQRHAQVRITYRGNGEDKRLLRFEIATRDLTAHD